MQSDESDEQLENTEPSRHESLEHGSNASIERAWQAPKQHTPILSIDEGMQIADTDKQRQNAHFRIHESLE
jgi:hypothetical protein